MKPEGLKLLLRLGEITKKVKKLCIFSDLHFAKLNIVVKGYGGTNRNRFTA